MSTFEVPEPILNSPFREPAEYWYLEPDEEPVKKPGRRAAGYFYRDPKAKTPDGGHAARGVWQPLPLVNLIRERVKAWRQADYTGVTRTSLELLRYWQREGRKSRLFFAQLEAAETIIFLAEARPDFRQGVSVPSDEPSEDRQREGYRAFTRYASKMATGSGKTTVMAMLAAWSILNKVNDRGDRRFSDVVLVVCPNVTIRNRLGELDPECGDASLYRTRDIVPEHLMAQLRRGRLLATNWHVFEPQTVQIGGVSGKVSKAGKPVVVRETIHIGEKSASARGKRYLTLDELERQRSAGLIEVLNEWRDETGSLKRVEIRGTKYVESDTSVVNRIVGREVGGKQNILVFNDEAHHAYRIRSNEADVDDDDMDEEEAEQFVKEATVWVDGLDRIHKLRGINFCVDLSATPYYLARVGNDTNRPFPWVVSDFGLVDAIESGLVKIPQLVVRDTSGSDVPYYFNIWEWIKKKLTPAEKGGKKALFKPEAVLKWAHMPIAMLGAYWEQKRAEWQKEGETRPPVFIIVCKNTRLARVVYDWLADDQGPLGVASAGLPGFRNSDERINTIRVDSKVVHETDSGSAKTDESQWMRRTLDTVGRIDWPKDSQGRPIYPEEFEELAKKMKRPLHPPGRDVRCIVSVGMLTEGWDCNTVTHIIGLRPFMSQLLCEQVVGRGLRRQKYELVDGERLPEEVAKVLGVPFEVIPFKADPQGGVTPPKRHHIHAVPEKSRFEIKFPRVEGYAQAIRNRVSVDWAGVAELTIDPMHIPDEIEMKGTLPNNQGRHSLRGPGRIESLDLNPYRHGKRVQELVFDMARDLTRDYCAQGSCEAPPHVLFPQIAKIVHRYLEQKVRPVGSAVLVDAFLSPYYGWVIERLVEAIRPDTSAGESPEVPRYETSRGPGSTAEVDFWTSREIRPVNRSHVNAVVLDTAKWEQAAAYYIDSDDNVESFVKNAGLGFVIPYVHNGQYHDYVPDFLIRLKPQNGEKLVRHLILEVKGFDPLKEAKVQAAQRWVAAVNADASHGHWRYESVSDVSRIRALLKAWRDAFML